jgi:hypothetical protein
MSASVAYHLGTVHRGAQGFAEFATAEAELEDEVPIYIYDRLDEPTRGMLEDTLAYAEGGESAVCFASGMAAISAALGVATQAGAEIVAHHTLYGCTSSLLTHWLPHFGVRVRFADLRYAESFTQAVTPHTRVVYFETPVNPTLDLIDIAQVRLPRAASRCSRSSGSLSGPSSATVWWRSTTLRQCVGHGSKTKSAKSCSCARRRRKPLQSNPENAATARTRSRRRSAGRKAVLAPQRPENAARTGANASAWMQATRKNVQSSKSGSARSAKTLRRA